jgi:hypothetical protein
MFPTAYEFVAASAVKFLKSFLLGRCVGKNAAGLRLRDAPWRRFGTTAAGALAGKMTNGKNTREWTKFEFPLSRGGNLALLWTSTNPHHDFGRGQNPDQGVRQPDGRALWQNCFR